MTQAERKAHKLALLNHLDLWALELETRPGLDWPALKDGRMKLERRLFDRSQAQRAYADKVGLQPVTLTMGRCRWSIWATPHSLRNAIKLFSRLSSKRFRDWQSDRLMIDSSDW